MKLFEPGKIGNLNIKNRIAMAPMGLGRIAEPDGRWGDKVLEYYAARAKGETGLIITGLAPVERMLEPMWATHLDLRNPVHLEGLSKIAEAVHFFGAKIFIQLTAGFGRVVRNAGKSQPISASDVPCFFLPQVKARELTTQEVEGIITAFGIAARNARDAGIDGVELHGHEGYLLDQFQTALWNKRQDKYGGNLAGRLKFPLDAIAEIKKEAGRDFPVIYRYGIEHHLDGGRLVPESLEIAVLLEKSGADALHVDAGCYETSYYPHPSTYQPPAFMVDMASAVKKVVGIPVISVGKLWYPELAEKTLQDGDADFIALGRGLLS
ncbi:MAG: NADH:flavin oxidoreductase, partial [Dehalococcoidia bacterium]|nr:NADH:flavin oxidoreductase [Dehalococcoidia bacterium]